MVNDSFFKESMELNKCWKDVCIIALDTETTGKYPLDAQLCEIAAVKWKNGEIIEEYQCLIKPTHIIPDEVIAIHNITNAMVEDAPSIGSKIKEFHQFLQGGFIVGHHSPFDLGFLAHEFENAKLPLLKAPALCSSLLSRKAIPECENHKLQTLIKYLNIDGGSAHRALDDAKACLWLTINCLERIGLNATMNEVLAFQESELYWKNYSIIDLLNTPAHANLVKAIRSGDSIQITYNGGSRPGIARSVKPLGIVRSPYGDYLMALGEGDEIPKKYLLGRITNSAL